MILFRYGLKAPVWPYFQRYAFNTTVTALTTAAVWGICAVLHGMGLPRFIAQMAVCAIVGNLGFLLPYHRRAEFQYFTHLIADRLTRHKKGR